MSNELNMGLPGLGNRVEFEDTFTAPLPNGDALAAQIDTQAEQAKRARKIQALHNIYLRQRNPKAGELTAEYKDLDYLTTERAQENRNDFDMLMGNAIAQEINGGDVWGAIDESLKLLPEEERREYIEQRAACGDELEGMRVLSRVNERIANRQQDEVDAAVKAQEEKAKRYEKAFTQYAIGKDYGDDFNEIETAEMLADVDPEKLGKLQDARNFARAYLNPLRKEIEASRGGKNKMSAAAILRRLDSLDEAAYQFIGEDEEKARMLADQLTAFAEDMRQSGMVDAADEFLISLNNKLNNWGQATAAGELRRAAMESYSIFDPEGSKKRYNELMAEAKKVDEANKKYAVVRGMLRNAVNESRKVTGSYWNPNNWLRVASEMLGDTSLYLLPGGMAAGTVEALLGGIQENYNANRASGLSDEESFNQAMIDAPINAAVELMPIGMVGGMSISQLNKLAFLKGKPGKFAAWVANKTQRTPMRAMAVDAIGSILEEGVGEPIVGGLLTYGVEHAADLLGIKHGQTKEFTECFDELSTIWTDPNQVAGLILFTGLLVGKGYMGYKANAAFYRENADMLKMVGFTEENVSELMEKDGEEMTERAQQMWQEHWQNDPEGMKDRILKANKEAAENGDYLALTGEGMKDGGKLDDPIAKAFREEWQERAMRGELPEVTDLGNGKFRVTVRDAAREVKLQTEMGAAAADIYLRTAIARANEDEFNRRIERLGQEEAVKMGEVDIREELLNAVSRRAGEAAHEAIKEAAEKSGISIVDLTEGLPEHIAKPIRQRGAITIEDARRISEYAKGEIKQLTDGGMTEQAARSTKWEAMGRARALGDWAAFTDEFVHRASIQGERAEDVQSSVFRTRDMEGAERIISGERVFSQALFSVRRGADHIALLEDIVESVTDMLAQARGKKILAAAHSNPDAHPGINDIRDAEKAAWRELGEIGERAREAILKADPTAEINKINPEDPMSVIEGLSTMAMSRMLGSGILPSWMDSLTDMLKGTVSVADNLARVKGAMAEAMKTNPEAITSMDAALVEMGAEVQSVFEKARLDAVERVTTGNYRAAEEQRTKDRGGEYMPNVEDALREAEENDESIRKHEEEKKNRKPDPDALTQEEERMLQQERIDSLAGQGNAPEGMKGIFEGDACIYNAAGGYWCGMIDKHKLKQGTEQVKVGEKGEYGTIAGKELTGDFQADASPLYVWKRKNGELQLISGRHRYQLMMKDENITSHMCYVFEENAKHNEKWARLLDYENNMRDDQADEITAGTYARETGYTDEEMRKKGLMRSESRSKRGARIGREATEDFWTLFKNGLVKPKDAEQICILTQYISDPKKKQEIQRRCAQLIADKKSWEYIQGAIQFMANAEQRKMKQLRLDFGADYEADLERMATYVEKNIQRIKEYVSILKNENKKTKGKAKEIAERLGISTETPEGTERMIEDLLALQAKYENIGNYPELEAQAELWDGETELDPVGAYIEKIEEERKLHDEMREKTAEEIAAQAEGMGNLFSSFSMRARKPETAWEALNSRPEEAILERVKKEFKRVTEQLSTTSGKKGRELGTGTQAYAEILALVNATRNNLPEKYKMRGLVAQMAWATFFGQMLQSGELQGGNIKGAVMQKAVESVRNKIEKWGLQGMTDEEIRKAVADYAGGKMESLMVGVAESCMRKIDEFLKDRAKDKIDAMFKSVQAKREPGKHYKKGVTSAVDNAAIQAAYKLLETQDETQVRAEMEKMHAAIAQMQELGNKEDAEAIREKQAIIARTSVFLNWNKMDLANAYRALAEFEKMVKGAKESWQEKLDDERARIDYIKESIQSQKKFVSGAKAKEIYNVQKAMKKANVSGMFTGFTSFAHKMRIIAPIVGKGFAYDQMRKIAEVNQDLRTRNNQFSEYLGAMLAKYSGARSELAARDWMLGNNEIIDTGIDITKTRTEAVELSLDEAREWLSLDEVSRQQKRRDMEAEAEQKQRKLKRLPTDEQLAKMEARLLAIEEAKAWVEKWDKADDAEKATMRAELKGRMRKSTPELTEEHVTNEIKLRRRLAKTEKLKETVNIESKERIYASKLAVLHNILILEQPWYAPAWESNGINADVMQKMKDFVGGNLLAMGYEMRKYLADARPELAAVAERLTGIPFPVHENYFPASGNTFLHDGGAQNAAMKVQAGRLPGMPDVLMPRSVHMPELAWNTNAVEQFVNAINSQNNYIATADFLATWKGLLSDKHFSNEMDVNLGAALMDNLLTDLRIIANATIADGITAQMARNFIGKVLSKYAVVRLAGNVSTILKNLIGAGLNAPAAGKGVRIILDSQGKLKGYEEKEISRFRMVAGMTKGPFKIRDIANADFIKMRYKAHGESARQAVGEGARVRSKSGKISSGSGKLGRAAERIDEGLMNIIELSDIGGNIASCTAMANAVYADITAQPGGKNIPEAQRKELALQAVKMMLDQAAQPLIATQKNSFATSGSPLGLFARSLFLFKSEALAKVGYWTSEILAAKNEGTAKAWAQALYTVGMSMLTMSGSMAAITSTLAWLYGRVTRPDDDPEKVIKKLASTWARDMVKNVIADVPIFGDAIWATAESITGEKIFIQPEGANLPLTGIIHAAKPFFGRWEKMTTGQKAYAITNLIAQAACTLAVSRGGSGYNSLTEIATAAASSGNLITTGLRVATREEQQRKNKREKK